jgi:PAS domain S-box-containing protein
MRNTTESHELDWIRTPLYYQLLDTPHEPAFDDLVQLAAYVCQTPIATITFVDGPRHWCQACTGLSQRDTSRSLALGRYTIHGAMPCVISDTLQDQRFVSDPLAISEPKIRFYAGVPLTASDGSVLGTLEVMDYVPRTLTFEQVHSLEMLARQVMSQLRPNIGTGQLLTNFEPRQAEEKLRYQQAVLEMASRAARIGGWVANLADGHVYWSDEVCAIHEVPSGTIPTLEEALQFYAPESRKAIREALERAVHEGTPFDVELEIITAKGRRVWVHSIGQPEYDVNGTVMRVQGAFQDITEKKQAEQRLQQLATRLTNTLESITDAFFTLDREWCFTYVNHEAERLLQRPRSVLLGENVWQQFSPAVDSTFYREYHRAMAENCAVAFEEYYPPLDKWLEVRAFPTDEGLAVYFRDITQQRHDREALRESEERFRQIAESVEDAFWIRDVQTDQILYISPGYETIFGLSREELYRDSHSFMGLIHPDYRPLMHATMAGNRHTLDVELRLVRPDGETRWVHVRTFAVRDESGTVIRRVGTARDITLLAQATEQLRTSERQYRLLFTSNPHPMWVHDVETLRFLAVNEAAIAHYGYSEEEFLSMTIRDIRPVQDIPPLEQILSNHSNLHHLGLWRHRKKDGTVIDVEISLDELIFNQRAARLVLANDVTARRQAEARVREQAALLDKAQDAILVRDLEHRITYWNQSAARLYGWSEAEALGKPVTDLIYPDSTALNEAMRHVLAHGEWSGELTQRNRDGREILIEGRWTLVRDELGKPYAILVINTDITERTMLEAHLLRKQRMESIGTLAGGIAHDFNNILTPILLFTELTMSLLSTEDEAYANLQEVLVATQRARELVSHILAFSREESQQPRQLLHLQPIIQEVLRLMRAALPATIEIHQNIDAMADAVFANPAQIHQVLMNLCTNAYQAMYEHGGTLMVSLDTVQVDKAWAATRPHLSVGPYVRLTVSDTGHGIAPNILPRIFDPFFTTKAPGEGTGLGLPVVYGIVMDYGGDITADSQLGEGAIFRIYLPVAGHEMAVEESPIFLDQHGIARILLVDDEDMIVEVTSEILTSLGYTVTGKSDSIEALALFQAQPDQFDLLITDLTMPQMTGMELITEVLCARPDLPTLLMSGGSEIVIERATETIKVVGAALRKPFSAGELGQTVCKLLQS